MHFNTNTNLRKLFTDKKGIMVHQNVNILQFKTNQDLMLRYSIDTIDDHGSLKQMLLHLKRFLQSLKK